MTTLVLLILSLLLIAFLARAAVEPARAAARLFKYALRQMLVVGAAVLVLLLLLVAQWL